MMREIGECHTPDKLMRLRLEWSKEAVNWPAQWKKLAVEEFDKAQQLLLQEAAPDDHDQFPGGLPIAGKTYSPLAAG